MNGQSDIFSFVLTLAQQTAQPGPNSMFPQIGFILLLFAGMYFLMIAPQRKKQKEHEKMVRELKAGDEVMTAGGIFGKVTAVKNDRLTITVGDNTKLELNPSYVHQKIVRTSSKKS